MDPLERVDELYRAACSVEMPGMAERREDLLFAKLLVQHGIAEASRVLECLDAQERAMRTESHPVPRLGELLVRKGYASSERLKSVGPRPRTALPPDVAGATKTFGKFLLVRLLGSGGMGDVWLAWDSGLERRVALKFVKLLTPEDRVRFRREAQVAAKLAHPNIAAVYEVGASEESSDGWIAMQYVEGRTLDLVPRGDTRLLVRLLRDAARAIHAAHEQGIVHRDLKPANIMVQKEQVFVLDFGLAKRRDAPSSVSLSGQVIGTPAYMPPEQARGELSAIDARSDVYSLGATLYHLLAGAPPFVGDVYDIILRVSTDEPKPVSAINPRVPRDLQIIVGKAMDKERVRRYTTAAGFADDLDRWLNGEAIEARPASVVYRASRFLRRHRVVALITLIAVSGLGVAVGWALSQRSALGDEHRRVADREKALDLLKPAIRNLDDAEYRGKALSVADYRVVTDAVGAARAAFGQFADVHLEDGRARMAGGDFRGAIAAFDLVIADPTLRFLGHYYRARAALLLHAMEAPMPTGVRSAGRLFINSVDAPSEGASLRRLREAALADLRALEKEGPMGEAEPRVKYGRLLARLFDRSSPADFASLARQFREMAESGRVSPKESTYFSGMASFLGGDWEAAIESLAAGRAPNFSEWALVAVARSLMGDERERRGQDPTPYFEAALRDFDIALARAQGSTAQGNRGLTMTLLARVRAARGIDSVALLDEAIVALTAAASAADANPVAQSNLGLAYAERALTAEAMGGEPEADYRKAIATLELAVGMTGETIFANINLADVHSILAGWLTRRGKDARSDLERAVGLCTEAQRRAPACWEARFVRGNALLRWIDLDERLGMDPRDHMAMALEDLTAAVKLEPESAPAQSNCAAVYSARARFLMGTGGEAEADLNAALAAYSAAIRIQPTACIAWNNRGIGWIRMTQWKLRQGKDPAEVAGEAVKDFSKAIELNAAYAPAWRNRGSISDIMATELNRRGKGGAIESWRLAIEDSKRAVELQPGDAENPYNLGTSRLKLGQVLLGKIEEEGVAQLEAAILDFGKAIERNPNHVGAYANRGAARYHLLRWEGAMRDLEKAIELKPSLKAKLAGQIEECRNNMGK